MIGLNRESFHIQSVQIEAFPGYRFCDIKSIIVLECYPLDISQSKVENVTLDG